MSERLPSSSASSSATLAIVLDSYVPVGEREARDLTKIRRLARGSEPWSRAQPVHLTGSALIVDPTNERVLLRWHVRMGAWLQLGGHADPGEDDPVAVARREAQEESGLTDLRLWPTDDPHLLHVVIVDVPAGRGEPSHRHADLRFLFATDTPDGVRPESPEAPLRWLTVEEALALVTEDNLEESLHRLAPLLDG